MRRDEWNEVLTAVIIVAVLVFDIYVLIGHHP